VKAIDKLRQDIVHGDLLGSGDRRYRRKTLVPTEHVDVLLQNDARDLRAPNRYDSVYVPARNLRREVDDGAHRKKELVPILFRYFMAASLNVSGVREAPDTCPEGQRHARWGPDAFMVSRAGLKMCLWYGMLYVVVEGWQEAKLSDPRSG